MAIPDAHILEKTNNWQKISQIHSV